MTRYDAIIFDIDGTLWNASPASAKGWNLGLAKLGIDREISVAEIEMVAGTPYEQCVDILLPGLKEKYSELLDTIESFEIEVMKSEGGAFFDGVIEGVTQLVNDYKIFIVSNCQDWYLGLFLGFTGLKPMLTGFDCNGMSGLPKNEMLSRMKERYSLKSPVYIGDTAGDETAARLANMAFIYVSWGFGEPKEDPKTVDSFFELVDYLKRANGSNK